MHLSLRFSSITGGAAGSKNGRKPQRPAAVEADNEVERGRLGKQRRCRGGEPRRPTVVAMKRKRTGAAGGEPPCFPLLAFPVSLQARSKQPPHRPLSTTMGGDGGTVSTNRTYLRGAGKACHTADHPSNALKRAKLEDAERARLTLGTCAASGTPLDVSPQKSNGGGGGGISAADIVACPYGKLYKREKVLEALLRRSQTGDAAAVGAHIRGMKDFHPVRFHVTKSTSQDGGNGNGKGHQQYVAACPITGSEIGSGNVPSFVIVRTKSKDKKKTEEDDEVARNPNVLSERAIKEMGIEGLQAEYGPFEEKDMIRLAPPKTGGVFEGIQRKWEERVEEERLAKLKKKKDKKRKRGRGSRRLQKAPRLPDCATSPIGKEWEQIQWWKGQQTAKESNRRRRGAVGSAIGGIGQPGALGFVWNREEEGPIGEGKGRCVVHPELLSVDATLDCGLQGFPSDMFFIPG
ncbi:hypothetical protein ACHAXT_001892 [Thalassiosira profunda]